MIIENIIWAGGVPYFSQFLSEPLQELIPGSIVQVVLQAYNVRSITQIKVFIITKKKEEFKVIK
jgi:hypothetical protein